MILVADTAESNVDISAMRMPFPDTGS